MSNSDKWYRFFRPFFKLFLRIKYNVKIIGSDNIPSKGSVILAANHIHMDDSLLIAALTTKRLVRFAAKIEYFNGEFSHFGKAVRWFFVKLDMVGVDRESRYAMRQLADGALPILANGNIFAIHPEGTRSKDGKTSIFKLGVIHLARKSSSPIVPIALNYEESGIFRRSKVLIIIGLPVSWTEYAVMSAKEAADDLRSRVINLIRHDD